MRSIFFASLLFIFPLFSYAQVDSLIDTGLSVAISPSYPSPNQSFTAELNDYGGGAFGATIDWYYNDSRLEWAFNQRSVSLTAPDAGGEAKLRIVLTKPDGTSEVILRTITPYYLDIILEPQTRVPSFYKGRALPSVGSTVNATALLSTDQILSTDYLYTWRINDTVIQGGPLRGGSRIAFQMPIDTYSTLSLTVSKLDGGIIARRVITVPAVMPKLLFYEVSTLYGMLEQALKNPFSLLGDSATVRAEPYYLDSRVFNNPSVIEWKIDGYKVESGNNPYDITLERTDAGGTAKLNFRVQSTVMLLQGVKGEFVINVI